MCQQLIDDKSFRFFIEHKQKEAKFSPLERWSLVIKKRISKKKKSGGAYLNLNIIKANNVYSFFL